MSILCFWLALSIAAFIDAKWGIVPNKLNFIMTILLPLLFYAEDPTHWKLRMLVGGMLFFSLLLAFWISKKLTGTAQVGGGDLKLIFWFGVGLGIHAPVAVLFTTLLFILTIGLLRVINQWKKGKTLPLIPFLWLGSVLTVFV
ncbi:prepilin peptidase [Aneurinibacillus terranovensis]|uniref:prepilin peptidase n=1 Tax=Aneurinibacillus terranovensis TaxID=278991 RepID=UPI001FE0861C|nr:prepilin peptidase [Aneurinibacillus terranovensis]